MTAIRKIMNNAKTKILSAIANLGKSTSAVVLGFTIILGLVLGIVRPNFFTAYNLGIIIKQMSFFGMAAIGQTLTIITIGTDLSVGAVACLAGIIFAILYGSMGVNVVVAILVAIVVCVLIGYLNGMLITRLGLSPFIITLGMSTVVQGAVLVLTKGETITGVKGPVTVLGQGMVGPIPVPTIIFIAAIAVWAFIMKNMPFGRQMFAIGGNPAAARLVGIKVESKTCIIFALSSLMASMGGIMTACRYSSGQPTIGDTWNMDSITAAVIGGTAMSGGVGGVIGTAIGALLITVLRNAIVLLNISQYWEKVITGSVVLFAVSVDVIRRKRKEGK